MDELRAWNIEDLGTCAQIKVVGVGGGGSNAVDRMIRVGVQGVEFIAMNTDAQALTKSQAPLRMRLGNQVTQGLGCGGDPICGQKAAEESAEEIREVLNGADMVFVTAGMGGGTGTGAAPIVARIARELGALTVAVVTKPFNFEGTNRLRIANEGLVQLQEQVDTMIVIPNDRLLQIIPPRASLAEAFLVADDLLRQGIQGISDLITGTGLINVDFNDVRAIMGKAGTALMAIGIADGENRAVDAAMQAVNNQLLDLSIDGATGVLFNVKGAPGMTLHEVYDAAEVVRKMADPEANIIFGAAFDENLGDAIQITVIATGFDGSPAIPSTGQQQAATPKPTSLPGRRPQPQVREVNLPPTKSDPLDIPPFLRQRGRRR